MIHTHSHSFHKISSSYQYPLLYRPSSLFLLSKPFQGRDSHFHINLFSVLYFTGHLSLCRSWSSSSTTRAVVGFRERRSAEVCLLSFFHLVFTAPSLSLLPSHFSLFHARSTSKDASYCHLESPLNPYNRLLDPLLPLSSRAHSSPIGTPFSLNPTNSTSSLLHSTLFNCPHLPTIQT